MTNKCPVCGNTTNKKYCSFDCFVRRGKKYTQTEQSKIIISEKLLSLKKQGIKKVKLADLIECCELNRVDIFAFTLENVVNLGYTVRMNV
jgi:hypothetical protein